MLSGLGDCGHVLAFAGEGLKLAPAVALAAAESICSGAADVEVMGLGTKHCCFQGLANGAPCNG